MDCSPTEQWLSEVLGQCEGRSSEGFFGWLRSLSARSELEPPEGGEAEELEAESCPELAPYPLAEGAQGNQCSFLLQGKEEDGDRPRCWLLLLAASPFGCSRKLEELLEEARHQCPQCQQSLLLHRGAYLCGERRILLTFQEDSGRSSWLRCQDCKSKWTMPQDRLLQMPVAAFFSLLWFCPHELPCGHSFASGSWELANATFAVNVVEPLALEMRGPPLRPLIPKQDICEAVPRPGIKEELIAVLHRAEQLLESQLSNVLRDFRQVGSDGQVPKRNAWFWNHSDERALKCALRSRSLLEASSILRRCAGKLQCWDEGPPLVNLGMTCHLHSSLAECNQLLAGDLEVPGDLEQAEASDTEEDIDISQACTSRGIPAKIIAKSKLTRRCTDIGFAKTEKRRQRSLSAPPKFGLQEEQNCRDKGKSLDDSSLDSLLYVGVPKLASMDPRMILKRFYSSLVGADGEDQPQPITFRGSSSSLLSDTWANLCTEPRRVFEHAGYQEPYDFRVSCGIKGMAIPLPSIMETADDVGAIIAHALLSTQHWELLRSRLQGHCLKETGELCCVSSNVEHCDFCSIEGEDSSIPSMVKAPDGTSWNVEVLAPLRFHLLRHLGFGNDANFCEILRRCGSHQTSGGKSKSAFWKSACGQLLLKEVRAAEASHLASMAGPFAVRLAEALRGEPSLLCEVFGLFKVSKLGKRQQTRTILIMRNLLQDINEDWQIFDVKGAAHRHAPNGANEEAAVKWDGGFVEMFGALPKVLKPADQEALELALKCDLHVLRELGLVDYSLLMAFHLESKRVRLAIIDFLQPYTLNKQLESTVKKLVQRHEPTIVEPVQYAKRFQEFIRKAFQSAVGSQPS